jgi:ankyrin repeat protein
LDVSLKINDNTLLYRAVKCGDLEIIKALLEKGADVNVKDLLGYTLLTMAQRIGNKCIVQLLQTYQKKKQNTRPQMDHSTINADNLAKFRDLIRDGSREKNKESKK